MSPAQPLAGTSLVGRYDVEGDRPGADATARLSPYLRVGMYPFSPALGPSRRDEGPGGQLLVEDLNISLDGGSQHAMRRLGELG